MTAPELCAALSVLAARRPLFHSEADMQHELALLLREQHTATIRLERPFQIERQRIHLDMLQTSGSARVGIELKYWKRRAHIEIQGESFLLKEQGAQDIARYDLWKDVYRLECLHQAGIITHGFAIALTSDPSYWTESTRPTVDRMFRLHGGLTSSGVLRWIGAGPGTMRGREAEIELRGTYALTWRDYAEPVPGYLLRALIIPVGV